MTFLLPSAAWFLALAPIIVALYLLRVRRRSATVSTLRFWQQAVRETRRSALFQRLRQVLSLLLHLLIFACILGALAKPVFDALVRDGASTVIVLDTRLRMAAREPGGAARWEKARALATDIAHTAGGARQVAIIAVGPDARVVVPFTDDSHALLTALDAVAPSETAGDLAPALTLARGLLAARPGAHRLVVIGDGSAPAPAPDLEILSAATPLDNVAITRFAARPLPSSPDTAELFLEIRNFGTAPSKGTLDFRLDGRLLDARQITLAPGQTRTEIFPALPRAASVTSRGWLTANYDAPDALVADNSAFALLPPARPLRVLLVSPGGFFLEKLLAADQTVAFEFIAPDAWQPSLAGKFDAVIFDRALPTPLDLETLPVNALFLRDTPFSQPGAAVEQPLLTDTDAEHPLLRHVDLRQLAILRAAPLRLPEKVAGWRFDAPVRSFDSPLLIAGESTARGRRLAAFAFDVGESDLPLRVAFPLLISNTLHWLGGDRAAPARQLHVGDVLALGPGEKASAAALRELPAGAAPPALSVAEFFQPMSAGYYAAGQANSAPTKVGDYIAAPLTWIAVNTGHETESNLQLARAEAAAGLASAVGENTGAPAAWRAAITSRLAAFAPWQFLALAAFALLLIEWRLFHQRRSE